mmetsp:Transcript_18180/g.48799  ORF Transcript_18180/g.48799 Transcript_18180/m.48799 type:complete len:212 (-) Transcript_18180:89-724(-)
MKFVFAVLVSSVVSLQTAPSSHELTVACYGHDKPVSECVSAIAHTIVDRAQGCYTQNADQNLYDACAKDFCSSECRGEKQCQYICSSQASKLFGKFVADPPVASQAAHEVSGTAGSVLVQVRELEKEEASAEQEEESAMAELSGAQDHMKAMNSRLAQRAKREMQGGQSKRGEEDMAKASQLSTIANQIDQHLDNVAKFRNLAGSEAPQAK